MLAGRHVTTGSSHLLIDLPSDNLLITGNEHVLDMSYRLKLILYLSACVFPDRVTCPTRRKSSTNLSKAHERAGPDECALEPRVRFVKVLIV